MFVPHPCVADRAIAAAQAMADLDDLREAIFKAVHRNDVAEVTRLLDAHPHLMEARGGNDHGTLLIEAAECGVMDVLGLLLERGADVNARADNGETALYWASFYGHEEMAVLLLSHGADIINLRVNEWTSLMVASFRGNLGVVRVLLQHLGGQGLDERSTVGETALSLACERGYVETARALLLAGADHTIADYEGQTPLQTSREGGHDLCVELIEVSTFTSTGRMSTRTYVMDRTSCSHCPMGVTLSYVVLCLLLLAVVGG
jgi:ankyrin repeat protein